MIDLGTPDLSEFGQIETAECGLMCVAAAAALLGRRVSAAEMRRNFQLSARGSSFRGLTQVAENVGLQADAFECSFSELRALKLPAILQVDNRHFVVLMRQSKGRVRFFDPSSGIETSKPAELAERYSGFALQLTALPKAARPGTSSAGRRFSFVLRGLGLPMAQLLALSLFVQAAALGLPLLSQLAINRGAMEGDTTAIATIAGSMALIYVANFFVELWRGFVNQKISSHVSMTLARRMFKHMLALPLGWSERRTVADVATRFDSVEPIRAAIGTGLASLAIDGILGIALAAFLFFVSPKLATVLLVVVIAGLLVKLAFTPSVSSAASEALTVRVAEQATRWETIRSLQSIKLAGAEDIRAGIWSSKLASLTWLTERSQNVVSAQQSATSLAGGLGGLIVLYVGALMVGDGTLSIGALFAFVIYRRSLGDKLSAVVDQINSVWALRVHFRRIAEVLDAEQEHRSDDVRSSFEILGRPSIRVHNVTFRHTRADRSLLSGISLDISPGEFIAITGPSGVGKSTLLRLICGLYFPTSGVIEFEGIPSSNFPPRLLRESFGAVMQEDAALMGTVFENVTMFDETPDLDLCRTALEAAELLDDVKQMPLEVHTPIGEGGRMLSAGQRQRLLLARMWYRKAPVIVLDEATSNVDPALERRILQRLRQSSATKIVVSHHPAVAEFVDKLYTLDARGLRLSSRVVERVVSEAQNG